MKFQLFQGKLQGIPMDSQRRVNQWLLQDSELLCLHSSKEKASMTSMACHQIMAWSVDQDKKTEFEEFVYKFMSDHQHALTM